MPRKIGLSPDFEKQYVNYTKNNNLVKEEIDEKMREIANNPQLGIPETRDLKCIDTTGIIPYTFVYKIDINRVDFLILDKGSFCKSASKILKDAESESKIKEE